MKREKINKLICLALAAVLVLGLASCSAKSSDEETTTAPSTTATTVPTTVTTTEDENTTFPESKTKKIYKGLSKDKDGSYPYTPGFATLSSAARSSFSSAFLTTR